MMLLIKPAFGQKSKLRLGAPLNAAGEKVMAPQTFMSVPRFRSSTGVFTEPEHTRSRKFADIFEKNFRSRTIPTGIHAPEGVASHKIGLGTFTSLPAGSNGRVMT